MRRRVLCLFGEWGELNQVMRRGPLLLGIFITFLIFPAVTHAQAWSGIISPSRAANWSIAGIPGGLPDGNWTQCGSTISPYSGTAAAINNALASCGTNQYVLLGSGRFNLSTGIVFPANTTGHVVLRGAGSNSTFLVFSGSGNACNGSSTLICIESNDGSYPGMGGPAAVNWTGGYAQGSTQITLSSVSGIVPNKTLLFLNQCDTGFSGSSCANGSSMDNGGYFVCSALYNGSTGCSVSGPDGITWRANAWQMEIVTVTAINPGGCGSTCVTISQPLKHPNWSAGQSPQAVLVQAVPQDGVENLAMDGTATGSSTGGGIGFQNAYQCWVSGVKITNMYQLAIYGLDTSHMIVQNNYIYRSNGHPDAYAIRFSWGGDTLVQNNIIQQWKNTTANDGPSSGDVVAYNYSVNQIVPGPSDQMWGAYWTHSAGDDFELWEGNVGDQQQNDNVHGSHLSNTKFRNFLLGWESCANGTCGNSSLKDETTVASIDSSNVRYANIIANVLGTPGYTSGYVTTTPFAGGYSYNIGAGGTNSPATPYDPLVASTMLRWGNFDAFTNTVRWCGNSSNTGWSAACAGTSEVPTSAPAYPNSMPTKGDTAAGMGALPASFYLSGKPSWFGSLPWPSIGPDVTGGNVGQCTGNLNTPGHYSGLPAVSSSQCTGTSLASAWGGHVNANPAMNCYLNVMAGPPDGTGGVLAFDATACYGAPSSSQSNQAPLPPTNLSVVVN